MKRFRIDPQARADLDEIYEYVAKANRPAARRLIERFQEALRLLATQRMMGQSRPELATDLRSFTVGSYVIYFRPVKGGIQVARVIHGARDIATEF